MKTIKPVLSLFAFLYFTCLSAQKNMLDSLYGDGRVHLIAPGLISTENGEYSPTYDAFSGELIFMRRTPGKFDYTLYSSLITKKGWSTTGILEISGRDRDAAPYFSPDGKTLLFDSNRPAADLAPRSINIWMTTRSEFSWSKPELLRDISENASDEPNTGLQEFGPAIDQNGLIYFYSFRQPYREGRRYVYDTKTSELKLIEDMPDPSFKTFVSYHWISPDGKMLLLEGGERGSSNTDLYYSCKENSGSWTPAKPIKELNTTLGEGGPFISADGEYLFFTSNRKAGINFNNEANLFIVQVKSLDIGCSVIR